MTTRQPFRAGDVVRVDGFGTHWMLSFDEFRGCVGQAAYPYKNAPANRCTLFRAATDSERKEMLIQTMRGGGSIRRDIARAQFAAIDAVDAAECAGVMAL